MLEYRQKINTTSGESMPTNADLDMGEMPAYMSLAAQYGLEDDMTIGRSGGQEQTVEQEYQAYITAPLSPVDMPILKFWEASGS